MSGTSSIDVESLASQLRRWQMITGVALATAVLSVVLALWALRAPPTPSRLRFASADGKVETVVDGEGVRSRALDGSASARLSARALELDLGDKSELRLHAGEGVHHRALTHHARLGARGVSVEQLGKRAFLDARPGLGIRGEHSRVDVSETALTMTATNKGPALQLTIAPDKRNPWAGIYLASHDRRKPGFQVRVAGGGNMLSVRSPDDHRRAAFLWASRSALISVKDAGRKERIELQTSGEGLTSPQVLVEHGNRERAITPPLAPRRR